MKKEVRKNNKGFSLVELIVVVAIMAVLMVVLAPAMLRYVEKTRKGKDDSAASEVREAVELALADNTIYEAVNEKWKLTDATKKATGVIVVRIETTGEIKLTGQGSTAAGLLDEVAYTVGKISLSSGSAQSSEVAGIKLTSKDRKETGYYFTVDYDPERKAYIVNEPNPTNTEPSPDNVGSVS